MRFNSTLDALGLDCGLLALTEWAADDAYAWSSIFSVRTQPKNNFESELGTQSPRSMANLWISRAMVNLW